MKTWYRIQNLAAAEAEILIYDDIGGFGVGAEQFIRELDAITAPTINVRINSYGGETFDGFAIFNALQRHPSRVITHIDGVAASAASYPALAGEEVRIAKNGMMMIHNPMLETLGSADELRRDAEYLDKLRDIIATFYVDRTGKPLEQVIAWMDAETWFSAEEALTQGFVHVVTEQSADPERVTNRRKPILNCATGKEPAADRVKALGLSDVLKPPTNAAQTEITMITLEQFQEFAAKNPDAVKTAAKDIIATEREDAKNVALNSVKPKNATAAELKAAFPDDRDFVIDRLETDAPLTDHKLAYADRLKAKNQELSNTVTELRGELAKHDPASAGRKPLNTGAPNADGTPKPLTPERKNELRQQMGLPAKASA